jgi:hypothetical protein
MLKTNGFRADKMVGALSWIYKKKNILNLKQNSGAQVSRRRIQVGSLLFHIPDPPAFLIMVKN